jgi:Ran GTPase-activating protein (RanGAP) involved in mRNA processing and transport
MNAPLHPRKRLYNLLEEIADSSVKRAEIRYLGLEDDEAFELASALTLNESLVELDLTSSSISSAGLVQLCQSLPPSLQKLALSSNPMSPSAAAALSITLQTSSSLIELNLHDCQLRNEGLSAIAHAIENNTGSTIQTLSLSKNLLTDEDIPACRRFGVALRENLTELQHLDLSRNRLRSRGLTALELHHVSSLKRLALWDNQLGPACGASLGDIVTHCQSLKELNLRNNELGDDGIMSAFSMITLEDHSSSLEQLFLGENMLSDSSAQHLAQLLSCQTERNTPLHKLTMLFLNCNEIGDEGAERLADMMRTNVTLHTMCLYRNKVGNRGGQALAYSHAANVHMKSLNITYNRITNVGSILRSVRFYCKLNDAGRYLLQCQNTIPQGLWPHVLRRMNIRLDVRYYFVRHLPELFRWKA